LIGITLLLNSFWLLPNLYYIFSSSEAPRIDKNNRLHSQEFLLKNRETGNLVDTPLNKGFYFNWEIFNFDNWRSENLMPEWNSHFRKADVSLFGYGLFAASLFGMAIEIKKKNKWAVAFLPFFWLPFVFVANRLPVFSNFFNLLLRVSFLDEVLRFVYTKFSILYQFGIVVYFGFFLSYIFEKIISVKIIRNTSVVLAAMFLVYIYPAFSGNLISPKLKISIPDSYFQFWNYMKDQPDGLVLTLPLHQYSGWQYYDWQYQGSGFIWFGLKQPVLDRDFDRWETKNEESYREFYHSLYLNNPEIFKSDLEKYKIKYIVWDKSSTSTSLKNADQIVYKYETKRILDQLVDEDYIRLEKNFGEISLYKTLPNHPLVFDLVNNQNISPSYLWGYSDPGYQLYDNYSTNPDKKSINFPFRDLLTSKDKIDQQKLAVENKEGLWTLSLIKTADNFSVPSLNQAEKYVFAQAYIRRNQEDQLILSFKFSLPDEIKNQTTKEIVLDIGNDKENLIFNINENIFEINLGDLTNNNRLGIGSTYLYTDKNNINGEVYDLFPNTPKIIANLNFSNIPAIEISSADVYKQNSDSPGLKLETNDSGQYLNYASLNNTRGTNIGFDRIPHSLGYIIGFRSQNISGLPLRFCLKNSYTNLCSVEDELGKNYDYDWDFFLIPPTDQAFGYKILLSGISYADLKTENNLDQVVIIPIPFSLLSFANSGSKLSNSQTNFGWLIDDKLSGIITAKKINGAGPSIVVLDQSFNQDWLAFYLEDGKPVFLKNHILINNWANGWEIDSENLSEKTVYFVFWPQVLEFLGFAFIPLAIGLSLRKKN
jgi:hypothetical protein